MSRRVRPFTETLELFVIPATVIISLASALVGEFILHLSFIAHTILICAIALGSINLVRDTIKSLLRHTFALDYIAFLAILVAVISAQWYVAAIIVLMLSGGRTLEEYAARQARSSLTSLRDRIPDKVLRWKDGKISTPVRIEEVQINDQIAIRKGEVIPLDGILHNSNAIVDESSLTGEAAPVDKMTGDTLRSGTVNTGDLIILSVTHTQHDSTYHKIIRMVQDAQTNKAPLIRIADRYSTFFTIVTIIISSMAYFFTHDWNRFLSVLVISTPCPLILATPIALIGGMNAAAKKRIIIKNLATLEVLARTSHLVMDKTGTITLGVPRLTDVTMHSQTLTQKATLQIAAAIERHSLHPLAKAIVIAASADPHDSKIQARDVHETLGKGIEGTVNGTEYILAKAPETEGTAIRLLKGFTPVATFHFEDLPKKAARSSIEQMHMNGIKTFLYTGDKPAAAEKLKERLALPFLHIQAGMSPEDKKNGIVKLKQSHDAHAVLMVGDGINDAPALAAADAGIVFSSDEHTASTEAADIVFLGSEISMISDTLQIGRHTLKIANESIYIGIGLSIVGMICAAFGLISPVPGAFIQEALDVAVILNALRAGKI